VSELQGLYGPIQVLEARIQQIWGLQEFREGDWQTTAGESFEVLHAGYVNRGAGPDFREARVRIGNQILCGDVEVHLYREDWWRHGHAGDQRYDRVVLHVVLYAGGMERPIKTRGGGSVSEWVMAPWLVQDLEGVAGGDPGLWGETAPELKEWMESVDPQVASEAIQCAAARRWEMKTSIAAGLIEAHGWDGALHRLVLYYLGYPLHRRAFWEMAEAFPQSLWAEDLVRLLKLRWADAVDWQSGRPAARAEIRLLAYSRFAANWSSLLKGRIAQLRFDKICDTADTAVVRRAFGLGSFTKWLQTELFQGAIGLEMTQRLLADVIWPVVSVVGVLPSGFAELAWYHGRPGHHPPGHAKLLREGGLCCGPRRPLCNGMLQGLYRVDDDLRLERLRGDRRS
jgi:hypothetical protein